MMWQLALCLLVGTAWSPLVPIEAQQNEGLHAILEGIITDSVRVPFADLGKRLDSLELVLSNVVSRQESMQQALDGVSSRQESMQQALDGVSSRQESMQQALDGVSSRQENMQQALDGVSSRQENMQQALDGVSSRQENMQQALDGLSSRQESIQQALDSVSTCQNGADQALESIQGVISQLSCLSACPDSQWKTFNGNCYWLSSGNASWGNARDACKKLDSRADLVSIHSREEHHFLLDAFKARDFWIGLSDLDEEGTFVWSDGSEVDFQNWSPSQPDNWRGNQDCVWVFQQYGLLWDDRNCPASLPFICKITGAA